MGGKLKQEEVTRLRDADWSDMTLSNVRSHQKLDQAQKGIFFGTYEDNHNPGISVWDFWS